MEHMTNRAKMIHEYIEELIEEGRVSDTLSAHGSTQCTRCAQNPNKDRLGPPEIAVVQDPGKKDGRGYRGGHVPHLTDYEHLEYTMVMTLGLPPGDPNSNWAWLEHVSHTHILLAAGPVQVQLLGPCQILLIVDEL